MTRRWHEAGGLTGWGHTGHHGGEGVAWEWGSWSHCICSQETEWWALLPSLLLSIFFSIFTLSGTPGTLRMCLLFSYKPLQRQPLDSPRSVFPGWLYILSSWQQRKTVTVCVNSVYLSVARHGFLLSWTVVFMYREALATENFNMLLEECPNPWSHWNEFMI